MRLNLAIAATSFLCLAWLTSGCSAVYEPKPEVSKLDSQEVLSHTAAVKNTFVFERDSSLIFCAEPPPDAAFTQTLDFDFTFALVNSGGSNGSDEKEGSGEIEMDGRTPTIMLARELLYRLCEFSKNHRLDTDTAIELYKQNLDIIKSVADKTAKNTKIHIGESLVTNESVGVSETVSATATVGTAASAKKKKDSDDDDDDDN